MRRWHDKEEKISHNKLPAHEIQFRLYAGRLTLVAMESGKIRIDVSGALRAFCGGAPELMLPASSVRALLAEIEERHPSLYSGICDETGKVRRHVNVFVNTSHIRDREGLDTPLVPGDVVTILPAVSGG